VNTPWKLEGFVSEAGNLVQHIIPNDDLYEHELMPTCWCKPTIYEAEFIAVHNSADQREAFERGERKPS
jgi:hypothetical protein